MMSVLDEVLAELKNLRVLSRSKDGMSVTVGVTRKWSDGVEAGGKRLAGRPFANFQQRTDLDGPLAYARSVEKQDDRLKVQMEVVRNVLVLQGPGAYLKMDVAPGTFKLPITVIHLCWKCFWPYYLRSVWHSPWKKDGKWQQDEIPLCEKCKDEWVQYCFLED